MLSVIQDNLFAIENKYNKAKTKHKKLCDKWTDKNVYDITSELGKLRDDNDARESIGGGSFENLVSEELYEFLQSVGIGDYKNARKELIDIIVLCLRALVKLRH